MQHLFTTLALFASCLGAAVDGWLGVFLASTNDQAVVAGVVDDSPAQRAGLQPGDVILAIGDVATPTRDACIAAVRQLAAGRKVAVKLRREGKELTVTVELGERPEATEEAPRVPTPVQVEPEAAPPRAAGAPYLGIAVREADGGLRIDRVVDGGPAAAAKVPEACQLQAVGGRKVRTLADLDEAMAGVRPGQQLELQVAVDGGVRSVLVAVGGARTAAPAPPATQVRPAVPVAPVPPSPPQPGAAARGRSPAQLEAELAALRQELRELRQLVEELRRQQSRKE